MTKPLAKINPLTEGPIARALFFFTLPILASNVLQSLNGSVNAIWVGHYLGEAALTATSNANTILFFLIALVFGVGMASAILNIEDAVSIRSFAQKLTADFPALNVVINNAGIMRHKNLKVPAPDLDGLISEVNINVAGVMRMSSAFIDILTANKGTIINVSSGLAFVPLPSAPIYSATKAAVHAYTQYGVEVVELMPPVVKTDLSAEMSEGDGVAVITTDELVKQSFASLKAGALEIRPRQAKQLAFMRRIAPNFINRQLWKASKKLVPVEVR